MNARSVLIRHRSLRWLVPVGVVTVAGLAATGAFTAKASESDLPETTPAALIAAVRTAPVTGFSGTILSRVALGLPELPSIQGDDEVTTMSSLLSGSHTLQVWYGGVDKQRIALLGAMDETDIFRDGRQLWTWNSSQRVAQHAVLPAGRPGGASDTPASSAAPSDATASPDQPPSLTPSELAQSALSVLQPSTQVAVRKGTQVADRDVYELTLTPRDSATRIGSVRIAVDGQTKLPLAVQVFARGSNSPAIDVAYTSVRFTAPASTYFDFAPPSGATVKPLDPDGDVMRLMGGHASRVSGSGWTRVLEHDTGSAVQIGRGQLGQALTPVSGSWGHGGLLESPLASVLVTSDGRVFVGAVDPPALYAAAGAK